jgi:alkylation response protein AidB-like acyl-CoA dehydrogenase
MPGFERGRKLDKVGQQESDTAELFFTDVRLHCANVIGEVDAGFIAMMERLPQERVGAAVSNTAHAQQILVVAIAYAKERKAFGQPIGSFQHNKFLLAELATKLEVTQGVRRRLPRGHAQRTLTAVDAAKAKWRSAQVQNDVLDACVQLYGGYGFMNEYRVARAWRDARAPRSGPARTSS